MEEAREQLAGLQRVTAELGLQYVDIPGGSLAVGYGVAWGDQQYTVVSITGGSPNQAYVTAGVVRDIRRDRLAALEECNRLNSDYPMFVHFLHDAESGWDVLVSQCLPVRLLVEAPGFLQFMLEGMADAAQDHRDRFQRAVGGTPYAWNSEDTARLLQRSTI